MTLNGVYCIQSYLNPQESQKKWLDDNQKLSKIVRETGILEQIKEQKNNLNLGEMRRIFNQVEGIFKKIITIVNW